MACMRLLAAAVIAVVLALAAGSALAQKRGGILRMYSPDSPASMSIHEDATALTFKLRQGVRWHDGKAFTARDVLCTYDLLLERAAEKLRANPRRTALNNLDRVAANGDFEVTFHLKRPQPAIT